MTDELNQALLRAFAATRDRAASSTDASFVAGVSAAILRRRRWQLRLRLLALLALLIAAALLAPFAAQLGTWAGGGAVSFATLVGGQGSAFEVATIGGVTVVSLGFAALVILWALRRS